MSSSTDLKMTFGKWPDASDLLSWDSEDFRLQAARHVEAEMQARNLLNVEDESRRLKFQRRVSGSWSTGIPQPIEWHGFLTCMGYKPHLSNDLQQEALHYTWEEVSQAVCSAEAIIGGVRGRILNLTADVTTRILTVWDQYSIDMPEPEAQSESERTNRLNDIWLEMWKDLMMIAEGQGLAAFAITGICFTIPESSMLRLTSILAIFGEKKIVANDLFKIHPTESTEEERLVHQDTMYNVINTLADFSEFYMTKYLTSGRANNTVLPGHEALCKMRTFHRQTPEWGKAKCAAILPGGRSATEQPVFASFISNFLWLAAMLEGGATTTLQTLDWWFERRGLMVLWMLRCNTLPDAYALCLRRLPGNRVVDDDSTTGSTKSDASVEPEDSGDETWTASQSQIPESPATTPTKRRSTASPSTSVRQEGNSSSKNKRSSVASTDEDDGDISDDKRLDEHEPMDVGGESLIASDHDDDPDSLVPGFKALKRNLRMGRDFDLMAGPNGWILPLFEDDFAVAVTPHTECGGVRTFSGDSNLMDVHSVLVREEQAKQFSANRDRDIKRNRSLVDSILSLYRQTSG